MTMQLAFETISSDAVRASFDARSARACVTTATLRPHVDEGVVRGAWRATIDDVACGASLIALLLAVALPLPEALAGLLHA